MTQPLSPIFKADALAIGYNQISLANNIQFELFNGSLTAIVGRNGAGKSTLLRTLGHLQSPLAGNIYIQHQLIQSYTPPALATKISLVLTDAVVSKNMTVLELITLGRHPYTNWLGKLSIKDYAAINKSIAHLALEPLKNKKCFTLSDGQLQRVMIARALAQDTPIILLDEPTTHLDLYHKVQIIKLLKRIAYETKKTIVYTSHEIEMAIQVCDTMLLLNGAENPFGTPNELIAQKAFNTLFPADVVAFDDKTGTFRIT